MGTEQYYGDTRSAGSCHGESRSGGCLRIVRQMPVSRPDNYGEESQAEELSVGQVILMAVRPELEQGTLWELASAGIENALDVTVGKKGFPQAVTCVGSRAVRSGATGATVNAAMALAAETLVLAGYNGAAALMPVIAQGIIAFILISAVAPAAMAQATQATGRATASSDGFVPADLC